MSARKTERLLNLVMALLSTRRYLSAEQLIEAVAGYDGDGEAARRMFERDKEELRELGVPLETGSFSAWDDEVGYCIQRDAYALPAIELTADEAAAVGLATRLWSTATLSDAAARALVKLRAAGANVEAPVGFEPRPSATDPALDALLAAARDGRAVRFDYRTGGDAAAVPRDVDLWGVISWRARWYAVGHDHTRDATRVFRLDRIAGDVEAGGPLRVPPPDGMDLRHAVAASEPGPAAETAELLLRPDAGAGLRRRVATVRREGEWDVVEVPFRHEAAFAEELVALGAGVVVRSPESLRDAVVRRLERVLEGAR